MHAKHPYEEARRGRDERDRPTIDTDADGDDRDRGSDEGGDGVSPVLSTEGTWRISTSRSVPPPTPVIVPKITACAGPSPKSKALLAPVTANTLSPTASNTVIDPASRCRR